jgi:hypothetical protein
MKIRGSSRSCKTAKKSLGSRGWPRRCANGFRAEAAAYAKVDAGRIVIAALDDGGGKPPAFAAPLNSRGHGVNSSLRRANWLTSPT